MKILQTALGCVCLLIFEANKACGSPLGEAVIQAYGKFEPETKMQILKIFEKVLEDTSLIGDEVKQKEIKRDFEIIKKHFLSVDDVPFVVNGPNGTKFVTSNIQPFMEHVTMQIPNYKEGMSPSDIDSEDIRNEYIKLLENKKIHRLYLSENNFIVTFDRAERFNKRMNELFEEEKSRKK